MNMKWTSAEKGKKKGGKKKERESHLKKRETKNTLTLRRQWEKDTLS